jgi:hypothetical protein
MPPTGRREKDERYKRLSFDELLAIDQAVTALHTMLLHTWDEDRFGADRESRMLNVEAAERALIRIGFNQGTNTEEEV